MGNEHSKKELTKNGKNLEKHENGGVNGLSVNITSNGLDIDVTNETAVKQNGKPTSLNTESNEPDFVIVEPDCENDADQVVSEIPDSATENEEVKVTKEEKNNIFGKMFKKKTASPERVQENEPPKEDQVDISPTAADPQPDTADIKQDSESPQEPESVTLDPSPEEEKIQETDKENNQDVQKEEDSSTEENPVMNFFKTLVTPTKTPKKETATPDVKKDQSQKETQPTATTTVAQIPDPPAAPKGMSVPPPPPPEPPKMEIKGEPAAKSVKPAPKEEPKAAAKAPEASKGKSAKDTLSKFFRPKVLLGVKASKTKGASTSGANAAAKNAAVTIQEAPQPVVEVKEMVEEVPQPVVEVQNQNNLALQEAGEEVPQPVVEEQTVQEVPQSVVEDQENQSTAILESPRKADASKASTLEAAAKPEPPPPVQEEKKAPSKATFLSFFKSKELLNQMATKVQAASTSGVRLLKKTTGVAAEPKKETPAPPAAAAESVPTAKAKEEPKAAAKSPEATTDNKSVSGTSQSGDDAANVPKKLEKRNSIHLFFKNLGQKRHSTDAGVQTEPVVVAPAPEKAK
ncbi:breast carcinoma-amplified sequence 1 [Myripristis murdjan]|uniref:breast carcinoma-amplified sequence 1 n=1 Tax=Myripristis murdjan TaxID=586833 RepID=UPI0011761BF5|nr:breast carcinoma-amplified sequence 1 homolog [Myripristis murdjan]